MRLHGSRNDSAMMGTATAFRRGRKSLRAAVLAAAVACLAWLPGAPARAASVPAWSVLPLPAVLQPAANGSVEVRDGARVGIDPRSDANVTDVARGFIDLVAATRGLHLQLAAAHGDRVGSTIRFALVPASRGLGEAGYRVAIGDGHIDVTAGTPRGLFYGGVTVWQLLTPPGWTHGTPARVADGSIQDHPRFAWRGLMLDSGRHFQSVADVEKLIDWMSLNKLNVLLWHITEDQGWRLEVPKYPELTKIGACRQAVGLDAELTGSPGKPYCGFYTEAQVREVVKYAAAHYVTIVPGIDLPGHSQAAVAAYPWLGVTGKRPQVWTDWGISPWLLNPNARTLKFVDDVLDEVVRLFPSKYVSIGGDEADKRQWNASPEVQAEMHRLGLKDMNALQAWFMGQVADHLIRQGRIPLGWDDQIAEGGTLPAGQVVMTWHAGDGGKVALKAIEEGHDVIMAPESTLYLDHYQSELPDEWPGRPYLTTLEQTYATDVAPVGATAAQAKHILGVQAQMWTELQPSFARVEHSLFPRLAAMSEVAWSPAATHDWQGFLARVPAELARYRALGIGYADSAFAPAFKVSAAAGGKLAVTLSNQSGEGAIRYTIDGSAPTAASLRYSQPLEFSTRSATTLRAVAFAPDGFALSAPRSEVLDAATLDRRDGNALAGCRGKPLMRLGGHGSARSGHPAYAVDVGDMCWQWRDAPLADAARITLTTERLAWRYGDGGGRVVVHPKRSAAGEFEVHSGSCTGPLLATLPLASATNAAGVTRLSAPLSSVARADASALCIVATGDPREGQWVVDRVALSPR